MASEHARNHLEQEVISTLRPEGGDGAIRTRVTKGTWNHGGRGRQEGISGFANTIRKYIRNTHFRAPL